MPPDPRRLTPRTDVVLGDPDVVAAAAGLGPHLLRAVVDDVLTACRAGRVPPDRVVAAVVDALPSSATSLRRVINATGVVVHTNLGRAPLSPSAVEALTIAAGATDVELDLTTGRRGRRGAGALAALARAVPAAEAVHVVNNGAAALALAARGLTSPDGGREAVIARGELVEIGDGFRIPELVESVGLRLREVGTTNRVSRADYAAAIGPSTAFVLKVHPSNFRVEGFTSYVSVAELAGLCREHDLPLVADLGSGLLAPHPRLPDEPDAATALADGATLVTSSGDKLLGGPQCGLMLGRADVVERLRRHPMARALRVDKLTLAALEATLDGPEPPVVRALGSDPAALMARATRLADRIGHGATARASRAAVGGGGAPGVELDSAAIVLPARLAVPLRAATPPVVGHVADGVLLLDLIAVGPDDDEALAAAVVAVLDARGADGG